MLLDNTCSICKATERIFQSEELGWSIIKDEEGSTWGYFCPKHGVKEVAETILRANERSHKSAEVWRLKQNPDELLSRAAFFRAFEDINYRRFVGLEASINLIKHLLPDPKGHAKERDLKRFHQAVEDVHVAMGGKGNVNAYSKMLWTLFKAADGIKHLLPHPDDVVGEAKAIRAFNMALLNTRSSLEEFAGDDISNGV